MPVLCLQFYRLGRRHLLAPMSSSHKRFLNRKGYLNEVDGKTIWIRALRDIRRGEELTYDYKTTGNRHIQCRCRPGCPSTTVW